MVTGEPGNLSYQVVYPNKGEVVNSVYPNSVGTHVGDEEHVFAVRWCRIPSIKGPFTPQKKREGDVF